MTDKEYEYDPCEDCMAYDDNYFVNEDGELEWGCPSCSFNEDN